MTRRRRNQTLDALAHRIDRAADIVPDVLAGLDEQARHCGSIRAASTQPRVSGGTHGDPVSAQASALEHINRQHGYITDAVQSITVAVNLLDDLCRAALGYRLPEEIEAPQCSGEVAIGGDTIRCSRFVEDYLRADGTIGYRSEGLCAMHRRRADRAAKGLTEEDAA